MRDLTGIARIIRILEDDNYSNEYKKEEVKALYDSGDITGEEAMWLLIKYL